jgi:hypothetical protein
MWIVPPYRPSFRTQQADFLFRVRSCEWRVRKCNHTVAFAAALK